MKDLSLNFYVPVEHYSVQETIFILDLSPGMQELSVINV